VKNNYPYIHDQLGERDPGPGQGVDDRVSPQLGTWEQHAPPAAAGIGEGLSTGRLPASATRARLRAIHTRLLINAPRLPILDDALAQLLANQAVFGPNVYRECGQE
jgi:hypothetical protein